MLVQVMPLLPVTEYTDAEAGTTRPKTSARVINSLFRLLIMGFPWLGLVFLYSNDSMENRLTNLQLFMEMLIQAVVSDTNECVLWRSSLNAKGYGQLYIAPRMVKPHRVALEWSEERTLAKKEMACHTCDVPNCFNPKHIYLGDAQSNNNDTQLRNPGTQPRGSANFQTLLTEEQVRSIKARILSGENCPSIAEDFPVTRYTIWNIARGHTWKHLI